MDFLIFFLNGLYQLKTLASLPFSTQRPQLKLISTRERPHHPVHPKAFHPVVLNLKMSAHNLHVSKRQKGYLMITDKQTYSDSVISKGGSHPTSIKGFPSRSHKLLFIYPKKGRNRGKGQYMSKWLSWTAHYLPFHQRRKQDAIELFS